MIEIKSTHKTSDLEGILELQQLNIKEYTSIKDRETEGFVTIKYSLELLQKMCSFEKQIIVIKDQLVIGYALVLVQELKDSIPVLQPMFKILNEISYHSKLLSEYNYYIMGQICIAKTHRGQGLFRKIYDRHRIEFSSRYDICITEVSNNNPRSLGAHLKIGFEIIKTYADETDTWHVLILEWRER